MYICVCVHTHIHTPTHMHAYIYIFIYIYVYIYNRAFAATVTVAHLRTIEVACCKITDNGCRVLAQYLNKNRTLKVFF
jgi:hypothetical protein